MSKLYSFLDHSLRPTWQYERAVRVALETLLLVACAAPVIVGWRSLVAQLLVGALRLHQAETGREKASIVGRFVEAGGPPDLMLPAHKKARLRVLDARDVVITWAWPVVVPIVSAAETAAWSWALALGIGATLVRVWFDKWAMPRWRKSRVEWRKMRRKMRREVVS